MYIMHAIAAAAIISTPALAVAPHSGTSIDAQSAEQRIVGGLWTGKYLQKDWTFEFTNEDGPLQGRFKSGEGNWQSLKEVIISGRSITFSIDSKPKLSFALEVGTADRVMSGTANLDGFGTVPFSATRAP